MKKQVFACSLIGAIFAMVIPFSSHAYQVNEVFAKQLSPTYALFTIRYQFGFDGKGLMVPIIASRTSERRGDTLGYELVDVRGGLVTAGKASAIVLSSASVQGQYYQSPTSKNGDFMLVVLVDTTGIKENVRLEVTQLPFMLVDKNKKLSGFFPEEKLSQFKTPFLLLKGQAVK